MTQQEEVPASTSQPARGKFRTTLVRIHRVCALTAMVWLVVLGATGFMLNHPEWRWARQMTLTDKFASDHVWYEQVVGTIIRKFQVNPDNPDEMIGGSVRGLWRTLDAGQTWTEVNFDGMEGMPMVQALLPTKEAPWTEIWLGTDEGLWQVSGAKGSAQFIGMEGVNIASLDFQANEKDLTGLAEKTRLFHFSTEENKVTQWIKPKGNTIQGLPSPVALHRFLIDLHMAKGVAPGRGSIWINDYAGLVMVSLSITGLFYWLLRRMRQRGHNVGLKAESIPKVRRWLFRFHAPVLGVLAFIPIIYLSATGLFLDHARTLIMSIYGTQLSRDYLPPAHNLNNLRGELDSIATLEKGRETLSVMTRFGLILSSDGGKSWHYDESMPVQASQKNVTLAYVHRDDLEITGTHGGPAFARFGGIKEAWNVIPGLRIMVMDTAYAQGHWYLKGTAGFFKWSPIEGTLTKLEITDPPLRGLPIDRFAADLHTGLMIHDHFIWVNDLAALAAIILCLTGFTAWWRKKWV